MKLSTTELQDLKNAVQLLENPGIAAKIVNVIGMPLEKGMKMLPNKVTDKIVKITQKSLLKVADVAVLTMNNNRGEKSSNGLHTASVAVTGGIGGFFGMYGLAFELPVSTTIMFRSIADIARSEGESINDPLTKLACLMVFALGGTTKSDDGTEVGYFAVRAALARSVAEAAEFIATKTLVEEGAPALIRLITSIAQKFSIQVSEKTVAQAVPFIGAAGGALANTVFISHFQDMARGHFIVRRLERKYGEDFIKSEYEKVNIKSAA